MKESITSAEAMKGFADKFLSRIQPRGKTATVVGLYGDLGAGKTTFTQAVAEALGITESVVSPTFVIMKRYEIRDMRHEIREEKSNVNQISNLISHFSTLFHIDAYRLEKSSELLNLGWSDIISHPENLILIEWPEWVADVMPEHIKINFTHVSENEREVEIID